jgi:hypothetical protein
MRFSDPLFLDLDNNVSFYMNHEERGAKGEGVELRSANTLSLIVTLGTYYIS